MSDQSQATNSTPTAEVFPPNGGLDSTGSGSFSNSIYNLGAATSGPYTGIIIAVVSALAVITLSMTVLFIIRVVFVANRRRRLQQFEAYLSPSSTRRSRSNLSTNEATANNNIGDLENPNLNPQEQQQQQFTNPENIDLSLPSPPPKIPIIIIQPDGKSVDFAVREHAEPTSTPATSSSNPQQQQQNNSSSSLSGPPTGPRVAVFPYQPGSMTRGRWIRGRWYPYRPPRPPPPLVTVECEAPAAAAAAEAPEVGELHNGEASSSSFSFHPN